MDINEKSVSAIRALSLDMIERANSGHPGMALGAAPMVYALYHDILKFNPKNPKFNDRDRVVFSAGHCSALIYSILHVCGFDVTIEDLKSFRTLGSATPGHPELGVTPGIDCSSGPLGQGFATAVGIALAEKMQAAKFNKKDCELIDHNTYVVMSEGCLMEGISYEAASLAGKWQLNKLIALYDCNKISIDGSTDIAFTDDIALRFTSQNWNVISVEKVNDIKSIIKALNEAKQSRIKPTLIIVPSIIGFGSELAGQNKVHGSPLKGEQVTNTKLALNYDQPAFTITEDIYENFKSCLVNGEKNEKEYNDKLSYYKNHYSEEYKDFIKSYEEPKIKGNYDLDALIDMSGRDMGSDILTNFASNLTNIVGGTADLASSTRAYVKGGGDFSNENLVGRNIHFGVREFAMAAITNGLSIHGGFIPFCSTFFVFSDYMRNAIRMAALSKIKSIFLLSHDSIEVGEDGPTHQPVEQLWSLRAMPNLDVYRPATRTEVYVAYKNAVLNNYPTLITLSKNKLSNAETNLEDAEKGAYILSEVKKPQGILISTGTEVALCLKAQQILIEQGVFVNVVSAPCLEAFERQDKKYKNSVLPKSLKARVSVETGATIGWYKYIGDTGFAIGVDEFGASAKASDVYSKFGITAENIANTFIKVLKENN